MTDKGQELDNNVEDKQIENNRIENNQEENNRIENNRIENKQIENKHIRREADSNLIRKSDMILIAVVVVIAVIVLVYVMSTKKTGKIVEISVDGEVLESFDLSEDKEYQVTTDKGNNLVIIKDGMVDVVEADCPDKVCVNHVAIDSVGETIICLPHKLVVEIVE